MKLYYLNELDNMIFTYEFIKIRLTNLVLILANLVFVTASKKKKKKNLVLLQIIYNFYYKIDYLYSQ